MKLVSGKKIFKLVFFFNIDYNLKFSKYSLGSFDDGVQVPSGYSQCPGSNNNIMNPSYSISNQYNQYIFKFSNCSINAFKSNLLNSHLK